MKKRFTYKLRPGKQAEALLLRHAGTCRWVWNRCVAAFNEGEVANQTSLMKRLTADRRHHDWLSSQPVVPQQQAIRDFLTARSAFLAGQRNRPKFKSKRRIQPSLNYTVRGFSLTKGNRLRLAGGITIPVVWSRELPSAPTSVRVYRDSCNWWWASFVVEVDETTKPRAVDGQIGIDWGVKAPATTTRPEQDLGYTPRVKDNAKNLAKYQRRMARHRKHKQWKHYNNAKKKAARLHRRVRNQRREQSRKWAQNVARHNKTIAVEDFKPRFVQTNKHLAKKASENAIGLVKQELLTAAEHFGCDVYLIDPKYTTMDCSNCGTRLKSAMQLSQRKYSCPACGLHLDRDRNAARNMLIRAGFNPAGNNGHKPTGQPAYS